MSLIALWGLLWLGLPPLLKSQAEQRLTALLGRQVTVGAVEVAPWTLALTVRDLRIAAAGGDASAPPQFEVARLHADASASSLFRRAPVVEAIEIDEPVLRVARLADGRFDVDDVLARLQPAPDAAPSEPARFALYNLQLRGGRVLFDDQPVQQKHALDALQVALPFLSNLPSDIEVKVEPRLAFELDGSRFDTGAQVAPFAQVRSGRIQLRIDDFDLAHWAPYVPATVPVRPQRGMLSTNLGIEFSIDAAGAPSLVLRGTAGLRDVALTDAAKSPLVAWQQLQVGLDDVQPLARRVALGAVQLDGLQLQAARAADGRINLLQLAGAPAPASAATKTAAPAPWHFSVQSVKLASGGVRWQDAAVKPAADLRLEALELTAGPFDLSAAAPAPLRWSARLAGAGGPAAALGGEGSAGPSAVQMMLSVDQFDLPMLAPYLAEHLVPQIDGRVALQARLDATLGTAPRWAVDVAKLQVDQLRVREGSGKQSAVPASWRSLSVTDSRIDGAARRVSIGKLALDQPQLDAVRAADGGLNLLGWLRGSAPAASDQTLAATTTPAPAPWQLQLRDFTLDGGRVRWRDARPAGAPLRKPLALQASALRIAAQSLQWPAPPPSFAKLQVSARVAEDGVPASDAGRIEWNGQVAPEPLAARGDLRVERLPLHALAPYVPSNLQLALVHADAGWRGRIAVQQRPAGLEASADGDAQLTDVKVNALAEGDALGDELLNWRSFALTGVRVRVAPNAAPRIDITEAALSDFYSRLVITEQGRFNLRDVTAAPAASGQGDAAAAVVAAASAPAASASAPAADAAAGLPLALSIAGTQIRNGRVDFTDRFVKPNYSAALSELEGTLGAFRAGSPDMATLALRGRVAGTGLLDVSGALNPTAQPLALDIRAKATDLDLAPLSPYAGRYAGYAIERGKLSMDVAYKIEPDGRLTAANRVVLNQLTFGERVDSPDATKLPVTLAIALLKDRNGVIDLDLPVSGSINDPQFSVFGVVLKILGNLLVKAVTAPFSLLMGGGADEQGGVPFVPGTDRIAAAGLGAVDKMAKALADRPALSVAISGSADPVTERDAIRAAALDARLEAERRRRAPGPEGAASAPLSAEERTALLRRVYADTKLPDKPRNFIGMAKDVPPAEMESRLKAALPVGDEDVRDLAQRRGIAVRDALLAKGLPSERLFLAAPKLRGEDKAADAAAGESGAWTPAARLVLSTR